MTIRKFFVLAFASSVVALGGCDATHRDTSGDPQYKDRIGQVCEVLMPIRAHGYTFTLERDKKTDVISIWNPGFTGPEVTFVLPLQPGTTLTLLEARECTNCPFDRNPEYRVRVSPEPPQFEGKPAYLRATSRNKELLRCTGGKNVASVGWVEPSDTHRTCFPPANVGYRYAQPNLQFIHLAQHPIRKQQRTYH